MSRWESLRRAMRLPSIERDVDDEIQFHIESRVADLIARGHAAAAARRIAEQEFGDATAARRELAAIDRDTRARRSAAARWEAFVHDLRFSIRSLASSRGLAAIVITLLALGVGANAAVFGVADEMYLTPPSGVAKPDQLHRLVLHSYWGIGGRALIRHAFFYATYPAIVDAVGDRANLAAYSKPDSADSRMEGTRAFTRLSYVTPNFFSLLGTPFMIGRAPSEAESQLGAGQPVAVISYAIWRNRFGGDDRVLGKTIEINGQRFTVVGVTGQGFSGIDLDRAEVWVPWAMTPWAPPEPGHKPWYQQWRMNPNARIIGRFDRGMSPEQVAAIATTAYRRGEIANVDVNADSLATVYSAPLLEALGPSIKPSPENAIATRLIGVAVIVLVIACANVANLLSLRGARRRREIAVRLALGISRRRLTLQLLLESVVLSLVAAGAAIAVATWGSSLLRAMLMPSVHWATGTFSIRLVLAALAIALATGIVAGVAPVIRSFDDDLVTSLKAGARDGVSRRSRLRAAFVVLQAALSVVLLIGAGLFIRSLIAVQSIDTGYDADRIAFGYQYFRDPATHVVDWSGQYRRDDLVAGLKEAARALAGSRDVERVALSRIGPMAGYSMISVFRSDGGRISNFAGRSPNLLSVSPEYFGVTGMRLVRGRFFTAADETSGESVIVVTETTARALWPGLDPIGQCLILLRATSPCSRVIGVAHDTHLEAMIERSPIEIFHPLRENGRDFARPTVIIARARAGKTAAAIADIRRELERTFPNGEPPLVTSITSGLEPELRSWRLGATLFSVFGALALLVATLGVYSVMAFSVSQRTHEMGVRIALGARGSQVARLILGQGLWQIVAGVLAGVALALASGRLVSGMLYETKPSDPLVIASVCLLLISAGVIGALLPALRATRVNPVIALRAD